MSRLALVALLALALGGACGGKDNGGAVGAGPTTSGAPIDTALVIDVRTNGVDIDRHATVTCAGAVATGTGFLLDSAAAVAACALVQHDATAQDRLTSGPPPGRMCSQIFGGAEVATIAGTLQGKAVDAHLDRKDGCGVADWQQLGALVGAPH